MKMNMQKTCQNKIAAGKYSCSIFAECYLYILPLLYCFSNSLSRNSSAYAYVPDSKTGQNKNGDPPATRTRDTLIKSQVLYRLS